MVKKWITDIREKTADMNREQAVEYVFTYYWYHMLLAAAALGLIILLIYHIGWGKQRTDFACVMVNQQIDRERDERLAQAFADAAGMDAKAVSVDSDYQISYGDVELEGVMESSYEKFFFNWSAGKIDAVLMPESFYKYCRAQGGSYADTGELAGEKETEVSPGKFFEDGGKITGIYAAQTALAEYVIIDENDPLLCVFLPESRHEEANRDFVRFVCGIEGETDADR